MYVAVKGGESAILASYDLLAQERRGDPAVAELSVAQICQQLRLGVDRVMTEGSVYDPQLAALAIKQSAGDLVEAIFLLRAYRATLPRLGYTISASWPAATPWPRRVLRPPALKPRRAWWTCCTTKACWKPRNHRPATPIRLT